MNFRNRVFHWFLKSPQKSRKYFNKILKLNRNPKLHTHTILKVKWQIPNIFTSFSPKFFWQFFSWNQRCQQLKSPKPQHFHEFFTQKNRQFSREIKVEYLDGKWRFRTVCPYYYASLHLRKTRKTCTYTVHDWMENA